ncbi:MAG: type II toxin-antitoxin system RelE/ParE family toxin [Labilithrix sp.]|nr:type II toxin-antitoxin system RelE/ParE family toxin [Labilithrix sp.]MCW5817893.1 type II toxin-antitoxin system RelE/ParE family toxin [Labilithrix sp.]
MKLQVLARARAEIEKTARWYEKKAGLGEAFVSEIDTILRRVAALPLSYPPHPDDRDARRALVGRFPYAVAFVVEADQIVVVAITHLRRRPRRRPLPRS